MWLCRRNNIWFNLDNRHNTKHTSKLSQFNQNPLKRPNVVTYIHINFIHVQTQTPPLKAFIFYKNHKQSGTELAFSLRLSPCVCEPITTTLSGSLSSLLLHNECVSVFPTTDFSTSLMNKMKGELLLSLNTT